MGETTHISWADSTLNIWLGCQETGSQACVPCYARHLVETRMHRTTWGPHGKRVETKGWEAQLHKIQRMADAYFAATGHPWFVFVNSLSDFFDNQAPEGLRAKAFAAFRKLRNIVLLLLTKRPGNIVVMSEQAGGLPSNCAVGATFVTQAEYDRDREKLVHARNVLGALFAFGSLEPLVERIDLRLSDNDECYCDFEAREFFGSRDRRHAYPCPKAADLDWVIVGGPTSQGIHKAWPTPAAWFESIRGQCATAGVAFHVKQLGEFRGVTVDEVHLGWRPPVTPDWRNVVTADGWPMTWVGKKAAGRALNGVIYDARPEVRR